MEAINKKYSSTQNKLKPFDSVAWLTLRGTYIAIKAWSTPSGVQKALQQLHLPEHKLAHSYLKWYDLIHQILDKSAVPALMQPTTGHPPLRLSLCICLTTLWGRLSQPSQGEASQNAYPQQASQVDYDDDDNVIITPSQAQSVTTPRPLHKRAADDDLSLLSLSKKPRGPKAGYQMLLQAQEGLSELTGAVKEGFVFLSATQPPQTPSCCHAPEAMDNTPMRALNAAKAAGRLEKEHLKDPAKSLYRSARQPIGCFDEPAAAGFELNRA
ncbi:hypothetical protein C8Q80DRAFT_1357955 [Daedaleopsis nitida]|nr:hypothetical protein C8Q80DRAFT_1357955 [Daedaleopsis nitida]